MNNINKLNQENHTATPPLPQITTADRLARIATNRTVQILEGYGNKLAPDHVGALHEIHQTMNALFLGKMTGRHVFDLPTSMGKTTAVKGFVHAVNALGLKGRIVICCEKVKAICDLKRELVEEEGIPEDKICLFHSYKYDLDYHSKPIPNPQTAPYESDKGLVEDKHQFVLITHTKLHGGYQNLNHSLLIYDEGLFLGRSYPLVVGELRSRLLALKGKIEADKGFKDENIHSVLGWLNDIEKVLQSVIAKDTLGEVALPRLGIISFDEAVEPYIRRIIRDSFDSGSVDLDNVVDFIRKAGTGEEVRFFESNGIHAVIFNPTIPEALQKLVILDASFNIRKINEGVKSLICDKSYADIKDCSDITIHFAKIGSGKRRLFSKLLVDQNSESIEEAAKLTAGLVRERKRVLLFIHKDSGFNESYIHNASLKEKWANRPRGHRRGPHFVKPVEALMTALLKELGGDELPKSVDIATWGYETAENKWGDKDAVVFVTVNELPSATVYTRRIDQMQDLSTEITNSELKKMIKSEKANQLLQAIGRGGRRIIDGKAAKLDAYVFSADWEELKPDLMKGLHGVKVIPYEPITDEFRQKLPKREWIEKNLLMTLSDIPGNEITTKSLWKIADPRNTVADRTRKRAISTLCADPHNPWHKPAGSRKLTNLPV